MSSWIIELERKKGGSERRVLIVEMIFWRAFMTALSQSWSDSRPNSFSIPRPLITPRFPFERFLGSELVRDFRRWPTGTSTTIESQPSGAAEGSIREGTLI